MMTRLLKGRTWLLLGLLLCVMPAVSFAQGGGVTVKGKITSSTGETLPGVSIVVKGTTTGTVTDVEGDYSLNVPDPNSTLVISYVGFLTEEEPINGRTTINVQLAQDVKTLSEVVVIGYGAQSRRDITGSIASVKGEDIKAVPLPSVDALLQGRAAGVQVTTSSGAPGAGVQVKVRGNTSINAGNEPLYVIDGVPVRSQSFGGELAQGGNSNPMADINPNDIESIEVLKDASTAAIYGARAANGVVLITTKRGAQGATQVDFSHYTGVQRSPRRLPLLNGAEAKTYMIESRINFGENTFEDWPQLFDDPTREDYHYYNNDVDWQDIVLRNAVIQNYNLGLRGGENKIKYAVSAGYFDQEGVVINSDYKRFTARINLDYALSKKVRFGNSLSFTRSHAKRLDIGGEYNRAPYNMALQALPFFPIWQQDSLGVDQEGQYYTGLVWGRGNPLAMANQLKNDMFTNRMIGTIFGEYDIIPGLTFRTSFGIDYGGVRENRFTPREAISNGQREAVAQNTEDLTWLNENTLTFNRTFNERHSFSALLGHSQQESKWDRLRAAGRNAPSDDIETLNMSAQLDEVYSYVSRWGISSVFGRATYIYNDKYSVSANLRRDGSSRFGAKNKIAVFPSVSGYWRVSAEPFMQGLTFVNDLKFRASYGQTGNQNIGDFQARARYGNAGNYMGIGGIAPENFEVSDLSWETTTQFDLGLDLSLLNNRLTFITDYYIKTTSDLLIALQLPSTSGFATSLQNVGKTQNEGVELGILGRVLTGKLKWDVNFNIAHNNNIVKELPEGKDILQTEWIYTGLAREGQQLGTFFGWEALGVFSRDEDAYLTQIGTDANGKPLYDLAGNVPGGEVALDADGKPMSLRNVSQNGEKFNGGDMIFRDTNRDGVIGDDDRFIIGRAQPKFFGGFNNSLSYGGFDLSFFFQYQYGNDVMNNMRRNLEGMESENNQSAAIQRRWRKQGDVTDMPKAVFRDPKGNARGSSTRWMEDGSYLRLKTITLGYNLPESLLKRTFIKSARFYTTGQNLLTFTKYRGVDPEFTGGIIVGGIDWATYPQPRMITLGLNAGF
jgi:TonB-linked SusC/RagA family outer membrane protein